MTASDPDRLTPETREKLASAVDRDKLIARASAFTVNQVGARYATLLGLVPR